MYSDQSTDDRSTSAPVSSIRTDLVAVLRGADGAIRQALAVACAATAVASASAIVEIVAANYLT